LFQHVVIDKDSVNIIKQISIVKKTPHTPAPPQSWESRRHWADCSTSVPVQSSDLLRSCRGYYYFDDVEEEHEEHEAVEGSSSAGNAPH
jgi:hypothetical protein